MVGMCCVLAVSVQVAAAPVTLFDDTLASLPGAQPWLLYASDSILGTGVATQSLIPGSGAGLVTDNGVAAGYSNTVPFVNSFKNPAFPVLDRLAGFRLSFELQVLGESHNNNNRAGFSVIALASDGLGIELGFWSNEIWAQAQSPLFTHAEGYAFDTGAAEHSYDLDIAAAGYTLSAGGVTLGSGALRDYSAFGGAPYTLSNYVFLGDNTGSAGADIVLGRVQLETGTLVPVPPSLLLLLPAVVGVSRCRRSASCARSETPGSNPPR